MSEIIVLRNLINGVTVEVTSRRADRVARHCHFSKYFVRDTPENWPPTYIRASMTTSLSDWDTSEDGYVTNG